MNDRPQRKLEAGSMGTEVGVKERGGSSCKQLLPKDTNIHVAVRVTMLLIMP